MTTGRINQVADGTKCVRLGMVVVVVVLLWLLLGSVERGERGK